MKIISVLSVLFLTLVSCNCQKKTLETKVNTTSDKEQNSTMKLIYSANTRGFYQRLTVENHTLYISKDRNSSDNGLPSKITDNDWQELISYFEKVNLDGLENLKAPTEKRFYDGAAIAYLRVDFKDKVYRTTEFDHGFPPVEIDKLINKINSLVKKEE